MDYVKFFDKSPLIGYSLGPSGSGIAQAQPFNTEWRAWFEPSEGVYFHAVSGGPTGFYPQTGYQNSESFSFTFDSGNGFWYCLGQGGSLRVFAPSATEYTFSGYEGQLYNNSVLARHRNDTFCMYRKGSSIYHRTSEENFGSEHLVYSGKANIHSLKQVYKTDVAFYRVSIYGLDTNADGFALTTAKEEPITQEYFQNFDQVQSGLIATLPLWFIEEPTTVFVDMLRFSSEDFQDFPLGVVPGDFAGNAFLNGVLFFSDDISTTPTGSVIYLTGNNNMSGGYVFDNG